MDVTKISEREYSLDVHCSKGTYIRTLCEDIAAKMGLCSLADSNRMIALLEQFHLPTITTYAAETIAKQALSDKKRLQDMITLIVPATIGCCKALHYPIDDLESFIKAGM